jgi:hypothetical protein
VFEDHIIIFSDKDCAFPDSGDLERDWCRWYRKAVDRSAKQVWGAERWIKAHPDRLFLDRACTRPFPIDLPDPNTARFHRIVVAHRASERCQRELGGSGSLMIMPDVTGAQHCASAGDDGHPFTIGQINPAKGFVHVLDDTSLDILMNTLDTITDFVSYLVKKEEFVLGGRLGFAAGEEELLAHYLKYLTDGGEHDFVVPHDADSIGIFEGFWQAFERNPQRLAQTEADEISYSWDRLIESFSRHILAGTQHFTTHKEIRDGERILRFFAREPRTRRRMLARGMHELISKTPQNYRATRVILPSRPGDPYYVFMLLPHLDGVQYEEYREVRRHLLSEYCRVVKLKYPKAQDIVGIATETGTNEYRSEDAVYYDARSFSEQDRVEAQSLMEDLGLFAKVEFFAGVEQEYPEPTTSPLRTPATRLKGRHRNVPCPCGSGKKFKKCCGQT